MDRSRSLGGVQNDLATLERMVRNERHGSLSSSGHVYMSETVLCRLIVRATSLAIGVGRWDEGWTSWREGAVGEVAAGGGTCLLICASAAAFFPSSVR